MPVLPKIIEQHVRAWTEARFFERGQNYFRQGRLRHLRRAGHTLKAECQGSQPQPYRVEATLTKSDLNVNAIGSARCSCPMGGGCKHVVALLLAWVDDPDAFAETETLAARLQALSKAQLVALTGEMIDRYPDLEMLLGLPLLTDSDGSSSAPPPVDAEQVREQVRRALDLASGYDYDYDTLSRVEQELERILKLGDQFAERGALQNAVTVYRAVAQTIRAEYGDFFDPQGEIVWFVSGCADALGDLLPRTEASGVRRAILTELFDVYAWDAGQGGYGIGDTAHRALLDDATPAEQRRVAERAREAFEHPPSDWARTSFAKLLLDLDEKQPAAEQMSDDASLDLCRRAGLTVALISKLLDSGRAEQALAAARHAGDYDVYRTAGLFVEHGHGDALRTLIRGRLSGDPDRRLVEWLRDDAAGRDDPQAAFGLSEQLFWARPSVERYRELRDAGGTQGGWDEARTTLIERLEAEDRHALLTRLYLDDGDHDRALECVQQARVSGIGTPLDIEVAQAAAGTHPHRAADLYLERACALIEARGRGNYAQAAEYLRCIRDLYHEIDAHDTWDDLIATLIEENDHLPAFQDELDKADL